MLTTLAVAQDVLPVRWQTVASLGGQNLRFSPNGQYLLMYVPGGLLSVYDAATKRPLWQYGRTGVRSAEFTNDSKTILVSSSNAIYKVQSANGMGTTAFGTGLSGQIVRIPSSSKILIATPGQPVGVYDTAGTLVRSLPITFGNDNDARQLMASANGSYAAGNGQIVNTSNGSVARTYPAGSVWSFSGNGANFVYGSGTGFKSMKISTGAILWDRSYIVEEGEFGYGFFSAISFNRLQPGQSGGDQLFGGGEEYYVRYEDGSSTSYSLARFWSIDGSNGNLNLVAEPGYTSDENYRPYYGGVGNVAGSPTGNVAYEYQVFNDYYYWEQSKQYIGGAMLSSSDIPQFYAGLSLVATPVPVGSETPYVATLGYHYPFTMFKASRATGATLSMGEIGEYPSGEYKGISSSWNGALYAFDYSRPYGSDLGYVVVGSYNGGSSTFNEFPTAVPVFVGNKYVLAKTLNGANTRGRILEVDTSGPWPVMVPRGLFPYAETPVSGRRDGVGFATINDGRVAYYELSGTTTVVATKRGTFPTLKKAPTDTVRKFTATFNGNDQLAIVVAMNRGTKTDLEYRLYDVKSYPVKTLDSRTIGSYSSAWDPANMILAMSRDGSQTAVLLDQPNGPEGRSGQIDYVRNADGVFIGRFTDQQIGTGFIGASYTTDTRVLAAIRHDGTTIAFAVPPQLYSLVAPTTATVGQTVSVTINLAGDATPAGTLVKLTYSSGTVTGPVSVTVPEGLKTISFNVQAVSVDAAAKITARLGNDTKGVTIKIN